MLLHVFMAEQLEIFIPSSNHLPPAFHPSHIFRSSIAQHNSTITVPSTSSSSSSTSLFYYEATLTVDILLSPTFLSYCRSYTTTSNTNTQFIVRSLHTPIDHANTFSIHNHHWYFTLDKSSYEEFGLIGQLSDFTIRRHSHDALYIVSIDVSNAEKFVSGKKQFDRLQWCLQRCYHLNVQLLHIKGMSNT